MNIARTIIALATILPGLAEAASIVAIPNQETPIAINSALGSIVQLPTAVRTVTPSQWFLIQDASAGAEGAGRADVRTFVVKPVPGATTETVTFVLASGRALALRFIPAPTGDKYYEITQDSLGRRDRKGQFLEVEISMMRAMLLDEAGGFARQRLDEGDDGTKVATDVPDLEFTLARVYATSSLTGYVFRVRNRGSQVRSLEPSTVAFARPNRAVLFQGDRPQLEPCPMLGTQPECETAVRMVVRGPKPPQPMITSLGNTVPPFAKGLPAAGGAPQ